MTMSASPPPPSPPLLARAAAAARSAARAAAVAVLKAGPTPAHVAFIMDGNRRYAEGEGVDAVQGHEAGYLKLLDALEWCLDLGVSAVSVFAFSVENFRRPPREVAALMDLAAAKLASLLADTDALHRHGVRLRVVGDAGLLPPHVATAAAAAEAATAGAAGPVLNVCLAYASRHELAAAVTRLGQARAEEGEGAAVAADGPPRPHTPPPPTARPPAPPAAVDAALYTAGCPPVDLLLRTSGEARLSDFMLWQSKNAHLAFVPRLWPALSFWDVARAVLAYQRAAPCLAALRRAGEADCGAGRAAVAAAVEASGEGASPPPPPPPPPPAVTAAPSRRRGARPAAGGGGVPEWAARPGRADDDEDEEDGGGRHKFDPQCPCCLGNRRGGADEGGDMPPGVEAAMEAKKAREAAVRAALAAARASKAREEEKEGAHAVN